MKLLSLFLFVFLFLCAQSAEARRAPRLDISIAQAQEQAATFLAAGKHTEAYALYMALLREDPDNSAVNVGLAQSAMALGEYNQAILALERLVDASPHDGKLRLQLARAHVQAGNVEAAQRELGLAQTIDPSLTLEMSDKILAQLEQESRRWQFSGRLSTGVIYDSNVNMGPQSAFMSLGPWRLQLDSAATSKESWGAYGMASLDGGWRMGQESPWWVVGDVGMYYKKYFENVTYNRELAWGRAALGLRYIGARALVDVRLKTESADYVGDDQTSYNTGPELLLAVALKPNVHWLTRAALEYQSYRTDNGREGTHVWLGEYLRVLFGESGHDVTVGGRWLSTTAENHDYAWHGWETSVQSTFKLPHDVEVYPFAIYRQTYYNGPSTALETKDRKDKNVRVGLGLSWFFTPDLSLDVTYQYANNDSTSPLYTYDQTLISTGLTLRF